MPTAQSTSDGGPWSEQAATPEDRLVPALLKWEADGASNSESAAELLRVLDSESIFGDASEINVDASLRDMLPLITPATAAGVEQVCTLVWARASPLSSKRTHTLARSLTMSEICPGGAQDGNLPLHIAARIQGADEVVEALLSAHPKGAETRDSVR